jgi:hypothetical protein
MLPMGSVGMGMGPRQFENRNLTRWNERRPYFQEPNRGNTRKGLTLLRLWPAHSSVRSPQCRGHSCISVTEKSQEGAPGSRPLFGR